MTFFLIFLRFACILPRFSHHVDKAPPLDTVIVSSSAMMPGYDWFWLPSKSNKALYLD